ncbi:MAG: glycosyltransferase [Candidatus Sumerlaeia bacterium]|nr:glycosyltransferase [Candidatus Sumerlaeia bacterium]
MESAALPKLLSAVLATHRELARLLVAGAPPRRSAPGGPMPLLLFSQVPWDSVWQRPQELALGLSRRRPVVFFGPVQWHEAALRVGAAREPVRRLEDGRLLVLSPVEFSGTYKVGAVAALNNLLRARLLSRVLPGRDFIYLTNSLFDWELARALRPRHLALDLIDDFAGFAWAPRGARRSERLLARRADLVVAGTGTLARRWRQRGFDVDYLPSGVHAERFAGSFTEPGDLRAAPRPRLLYVGTLNDRLDASLLLRAAEANRSGSVVAVGPRHGSFALPGPAPKNLLFLGLKPHSDLPAYYAHCDAGIMPFADTPAARAINPVKALEYLAAGLPVLSTPIPDVVAEYPPHATIAAAPDWPAALAELLARREPETVREARRAFARGRSWGAMVDAFEERIGRLEAAEARA